MKLNLIKESEFREQIRDLSKLFGYSFYFTHRSQHSPAGWPDCVLARLEPTPRLIIAELKTDDLSTSQPSFEQYAWLYLLQQFSAPVECYLWRPGDFDEIARILE